MYNSVLPDDVVPVETNLAGFAVVAVDIVEASQGFADGVAEGFLDAGHTDVAAVPVGVQQVLHALANARRVQCKDMPSNLLSL